MGQRTALPGQQFGVFQRALRFLLRSAFSRLRSACKFISTPS